MQYDLVEVEDRLCHFTGVGWDAKILNDYLRNLESFAWGGSDFDEVLKLAFEGANARTLLRQLGYSSQLPSSGRGSRPQAAMNSRAAA